MRICVFGAGAIGGHLAGRLAEAGVAVSVVARGPHLASMQAQGLIVEAPDRTIRARVTATDDPSSLGPQDAVLVTVKAPSLPSVAKTIGPLLGPETPVAFVMNGIPWWYFDSHGGAHDGRRLSRIDPGDGMREAVGPGRVLGGVVYSACTVTAPGVVTVAGAGSRLVLGEPNPQAPPGRAEAIAAPLREGGLEAVCTGGIRDEIWSKLLINLCNAPLTTLAGTRSDGVFSEPACVDAAHRILREGAAIAAAMGCRPRHDPAQVVANLGRLKHMSSIAQDLQSGRPMEIDALFGVPLEFARLANVPTPTLDLLVALVTLRAEAAGLHAR